MEQLLSQFILRDDRHFYIVLWILVHNVQSKAVGRRQESPRVRSNYLSEALFDAE